MSLRNPKSLSLALVAAVVAVSVAAWFFVISPKRGEATKLESDIASVQADLVRLRAEQSAAKDDAVPQLQTLRNAMPDDEAMSNVVRELDRMTSETGVSLAGITPAEAVVGPGFRMIPIDAQLDGRFSELSSFLARMRKLVEARNGKLTVDGRLYTIESIALGPGDKNFPHLRATMRVNVFAYGAAGAVPAATPAATPAPAS